jgi:hypothetical protein
MRPYVADLNALAIRRGLGPANYGPPEALGADTWRYTRKDRTGRVMVSLCPYEDDAAVWIHASISWLDRTPSYEDLKLLHRAVFGDRHAYQVFVPSDEHYNHHEYCLHLWGRLDGTRALPDFAGPGGTV